MSQHTPGPWWVQKDGVTVCPPRPRGQTIICRVAPVHMMRAEREANARLIAEAPELLCCLNQALAQHDLIREQHPTFHEAFWVPMARAAIARVIGGTAP